MAKQKVFEELEREIEYYSPHTQRQYRAHVGEYLKFVGNRDWRDRDVLYNYITKLRKSNYDQSYITYLLRGPLGTLFRAHDLKLPAKVPKFKGPKVDITSLIVFTYDEVLRMIKVARASNNPQWQAYLAISTTWASRATEISQVRKQDVGSETIKIFTLKGGLVREHILPPQLAPYFSNYSFPPVTPNRMSDIFDEICAAAQVPRPSRKSWHAVRHSVITQLMLRSGLQETVIYNFTGWTPPGMVGVYYTPQVFEEDQVVYPKHPFLKLWG